MKDTVQVTQGIDGMAITHSEIKKITALRKIGEMMNLTVVDKVTVITIMCFPATTRVQKMN